MQVFVQHLISLLWNSLKGKHFPTLIGQVGTNLVTREEFDIKTSACLNATLLDFFDLVFMTRNCEVGKTYTEPRGRPAYHVKHENLFCIYHRCDYY